jgi:hypothetical protein
MAIAAYSSPNIAEVDKKIRARLEACPENPAEPERIGALINQ